MGQITSALSLVLSGGVGNSSPLQSIGGAASGTAAQYVVSQSYTASAIPGIEITHASRNPDGAGYLQYTASNQSVTWTNPLGVVSFVTLSADEWAAVGQAATGYLRLRITPGSLPGADQGQEITVAQENHTLFHQPASNELTSGLTDYRALYLWNQSAASAVNVSLALSSQTPESVVTIGSTFNSLSRFATPAAEGLDFRCVNHIGNIAPYSASLSGAYRRERLITVTGSKTPSMTYFPPDWGQSSNGVNEEIEVLLAGYTDPTGKLAQVEWGASLFWATIAPGRMVSFWLRRVVPPNPTLPTFEKILLDLDFTLQ